MSIASKNRKRKKRLRRLYENIVEAKVMRFAGQVLEAQHEARVAKENELKIRKTLDELVARHLQIGIMKGGNIAQVEWKSPPVSVLMPKERSYAWTTTTDQIYDIGSFIKHMPGFRIGWRQMLGEMARDNRYDSIDYLEMIADHIGQSIARCVLEKFVEEAKAQTQEKTSAAARVSVETVT